MQKYLFAISLTFIVLAHQVQADVRAFFTQSIDSEIMQESLDIHIQLPLFYKENDDYRYPVIYVLDAPVGLTLTAGVLDPLVGYNNAPQMIIVGISSSNRNRDLTPSRDSKYEPVSGGADKYLAFIEEEIIPFVEQNYRTEKFRILSGHSYGGLFVMHAFHSKPNLFQAHFAFSPSLFWSSQKTVNKVVSFIEKNKSYKNFIYMNIGNEGNTETGSPEGKGMLQGVVTIENALKQSVNDNLDYRIEKFLNEPHQTTQIYGTVSSFRGLYPQWDAPYETYIEGYDSLLKHFDRVSEKYGYQIEPKNWLMNDEGLYQLDEKNNPTEALKYFTYNLQRNPTSIEALRNTVKAFIKLDNPKEALKHINKLLEVPDVDTKQREEFLEQRVLLLDNINDL